MMLYEDTHLAYARYHIEAAEELVRDNIQLFSERVNNHRILIVILYSCLF